MEGLFYSVYQYFKSRTILFVSFILLVFGCAGYFALQIELEEDISKIMPHDEKIDKLNMVFKSNKFVEKLVVTLSFSDSLSESPIDELKQFSDSLVVSLEALCKPKIIKKITHKIAQEKLFEVYDIFYDNLPIFLEKQDYAIIDSLIAGNKIEQKLESNYKSLISPGGFAMKKFIMKDPLGFSGLALNKLKTLDFGDNYNLDDGYLITKDNRHLVLFIEPSFGTHETAKNTLFLAKLDSILVEKNKHQSVQAEYYGAMAVAVGNANQIKRDIRFTVGIALGLLLIFVSIFFRRYTAFILIFMPVLFGASIALAYLGISGVKVSAIALGIGSVLLGISVDFSLHILTHFRNTNSIESIFRDIAAPIIMSCLTTAAAFFCLTLLQSEALSQLGVFAAVSVLGTAIFSLIILPQMLTDGKQPNDQVKQSFLDKFSAINFHNNRYLIVFSLCFTLVCIFYYDRVGFEADLNRMNFMSDELKQAEDNLNKVNGYALKSMFIVSSGKSMNEALLLSSEASKKAVQLKEQGIISNYSGVSSILISLEEQLSRIAYWNDYWTPEKRKKLKYQIVEQSKYYKFKETAFMSFFNLLDKPYYPMSQTSYVGLKEQFVGDYISETDSNVMITTLLKVEQEKMKQVYKAFEENDAFIIVDKQYLTSRFVQLLKNDFDKLVLLSFAIVLLILFISFGRLEVIVITLIPIAGSWIWTLGIMGILGLQFNIFNIIICTFIFGLGVDYSIFITKGLLQDYNYGIKHVNSYKTSILLSGVTTMAGVGVLVFAKHPALHSIALISIIGLVSVIFLAFTLQPLLFNFFILNRKKKRMVPLNFLNVFLSIFAFSYFVLGCFLSTMLSYVLPMRIKKTKLIYHYVLQAFTASIIVVMINVRKRLVNLSGEDFSKPAVIIANHQSFLDILLLVMMNPKVLLLTNDWVYNSPFFGKVVQRAGYFHATSGNNLEEGVAKLKDMILDGYSVVVFPEGTRASDMKIKRFHKGAFYIAEQFNLDIVPVILHGTGHAMRKGDDFLLKNRLMSRIILPRIKATNKEFGTNYAERTKKIGRYFRAEFEKYREQVETPNYFKDQLIKNYLYKGNKVLNYLRVKLLLEDNYNTINNYVPKSGKIVDLGCGYGFLDYMLSFVSEKRTITGIDWDGEKIAVASNCPLKTEQINFVQADLSNFDLPEADCFLFIDALHYLDYENQLELLNNMFKKISNDGCIIIRESEPNLFRKHQMTKLTEYISKKIRFNKTGNNKFSYISGREIETIASKYGFVVRVDDTQSVITSTILYVITKD